MIRTALAVAAVGAALISGASPAPARGAPSAGADSVRVCVLVGDSLREVPAAVDAATGDTLVGGGQRFRDAHPSGTGYAESAEWYIASSPMVLGGRRYEKFGLPRVARPELLAPAGRHEGVPLFAEAGAAARPPEVYYVPVRPGCVFQPYLVPHANVRGRR